MAMWFCSFPQNSHPQSPNRCACICRLVASWMLHSFDILWRLPRSRFHTLCSIPILFTIRIFTCVIQRLLKTMPTFHITTSTNYCMGPLTSPYPSINPEKSDRQEVSRDEKTKIHSLNSHKHEPSAHNKTEI